jgi:hypothetical protein
MPPVVKVNQNIHDKLKFTKFYQGVPIAKSRQKMQRDLINEVLMMGSSNIKLYAILDQFENLLYFEQK